MSSTTRCIDDGTLWQIVIRCASEDKDGVAPRQAVRLADDIVDEVVRRTDAQTYLGGPPNTDAEVYYELLDRDGDTCGSFEDEAEGRTRYELARDDGSYSPYRLVRRETYTILGGAR